MDSNLEQNIKEEQKKRRAYLFSLVGVLTLVVAIIGTTYAFFQLTATNNNINGSAANVGLDLTITKHAPADNNVDNLVPIYGTQINNDLMARACKMGNNKVCQVYEVMLQNTGSTDITVSGTISFNGIEQMPNLKWAVNESQIFSSPVGTSASADATSLGGPITIYKNGIEFLFILVWIEETGEVQTDSGTFTATVTYETAEGQGVTSTIKS